ncbi:hypothetical protein GCM10010435_73550 [Winogradskya consettensis]|uniref:Uncharacterized protein n=1 Tax=Winogradskya consettensis TaxID=113560 RepID=A0A919SPD6_9ACTN|nr:hypothetical protein Aco04nite_44030 [Actinoplanes consettensis]
MLCAPGGSFLRRHWRLRTADVNRRQRERAYWMVCEAVRLQFVTHPQGGVMTDRLNRARTLRDVTLIVAGLPWFRIDPTFGR